MNETAFQNTTACYNPASGELLGHSPVTGAEELESIVAQARIAQQVWAKFPLSERVNYVLRIRDWIVEHGDEIAMTIHRDNGKSPVDAMATEVLSSAIAANYYAKNAKKFLKPKKLRPGNIILSYKQSTIYREPFGVIGIISPWNYPFTIPFHEVIIGLLSGNAIILKTARETQMVGRKLEECIQAADLPDGVFNYVNMAGKNFGQQIFSLGIDKLFFTGGQRAGAQLMAEAAKTVTPVSLELGSNDAMIICEDADLERAAGGAVWAGMQNSGQSCGGIERIYVHENVYEPFLELLKSYTESLKCGLECGKGMDYGVMTTTEQVDTVNRHLENALELGAEIFVESQIPESANLQNFVPARVLTGVNHSMDVMREETFGPVVGVMSYGTDREAIALANDSIHGLTSSVWSKDRKRAEKIARQIQSGTVLVNDHLMSHGMAETPWGGFKKSGIGRTHGALGFEEMTQPQVVVRDRLSFTRRALWWHPYSEKLYNGLSAILELLYGKTLRRRLKGFWYFLTIIPRLFRSWKTGD
ncbi:MAG: aldehyde dehydrogenase family protein [Candidatus Marinimicrobia bacterium]|nr:aldehyde dehydrogenase family protein [Candidatus Neomarinimicrobiota bacterium]MCF7829947.1 aldehyde dehydrogenase family protein [Candidatus Neomarinimicrobiota bacterium]MCF7881899.1 aldehyde dehydrogenase family protein [Candidatus Neomarinimicrobiota bacterium]